jgi:hypothetical protein
MTLVDGDKGAIHQGLWEGTGKGYLLTPWVVTALLLEDVVVGEAGASEVTASRT